MSSTLIMIIWNWLGQRITHVYSFSIICSALEEPQPSGQAGGLPTHRSCAETSIWLHNQLSLYFIQGRSNECYKQTPGGLFVKVTYLPVLALLSLSRCNLSISNVYNTEISPDFLVWELCGNLQFPQSSRKISLPEIQVKFCHFMQ